jgi:carbon storage regulator CsrA
MSIEGRSVKIGVDAPSEIAVDREEIRVQKEANKEAVNGNR